MIQNNVNFLETELEKIIVSDSELPHCIFHKAFGRYLFFDADLRSSDSLISILNDIARACLGSIFRINIFSSSNKAFLGFLDEDSNWISKINELNKQLHISGDVDGLILIDVSQKWVVYQKRPVDIGVFAFNHDGSLHGFESAIGESFFGCVDVANWIVGTSEREIELIKTFGLDYFVALIKNYCNSSY